MYSRTGITLLVKCDSSGKQESVKKDLNTNKEVE